MAEIQADGRDFAVVDPQSIGKVVNATAGVLSLVLVLGIGIWGYKMMMRDVSGIPVVRAATGDMRIKPDTPGGRPAAHQGLSVNKVAAEGAAGRVPDQVILAPAPISLSEDDLPRAQLKARAEERSARAARTAAAKAAKTVVSEAVAEDTRSAVEALAEALAADATKLGAAPEVPVEKTYLAGFGTARAIAMSQPPAKPAQVRPGVGKGGLIRSLRPRLRPADLIQVAAPAATDAAPITPPAPLAPSLDVDPASIAEGTSLAQLGAFDNTEQAVKEWKRLAGLFGDYMDDKKRVIQKASSGGRDFYRLRAMGFADVSDARRFCAAFVAQRTECIPVVTK